MQQRQQRPAWHQNPSIKMATRLTVVVVLSLFLANTLRDWGGTNPTPLFFWLKLLATLTFLVTDTICIVLFVKGLRQIARERRAESISQSRS